MNGNWVKTLNFDSMIVFSGWNLHRKSRCCPLTLNTFLWKYIYFTSCPVNMMSLNCLVVYENDNISQTRIFLTLFSSHGYVHFGYKHQLGSARVSKELSLKQFSFEVISLLSQISIFLIQSNMLTPLEIFDA